jgi:hypothetical protein
MEYHLVGARASDLSVALGIAASGVEAHSVIRLLPGSPRPRALLRTDGGYTRAQASVHTRLVLASTTSGISAFSGLTSKATIGSSPAGFS